MSDRPDIIAALELPAEAKLGQRVPKKLLLENGVTATGDRRLVQDSLESLIWSHSLKPKNTGLAPFKDAQSDYSELAVLRAVLRSRQKCSRLAEIIHRAVPYPVVLVMEDEQGALLSLAPKRASEAEAGQFVIEDRVESTGFLDAIRSPSRHEPFQESIALGKLAAKDLKAAYLAWLRCVLSYLASEVSGRYSMETGSAQDVREALDARRSIEIELNSLRNQAKRATQLSRQVELNLQIKDLEKALESLTARL